MERKLDRTALKGYLMVIIAAISWGLSGTVAQVLFQQEGFDPGWLVSMRMMFSGVILLLLGYVSERNRIWAVWKNQKDRIQLLIFGIVGILGVQYTYFASIHTGNAAMATLLQYLAPSFIIIYLAFYQKRRPSTKETTAVILALIGTLFLVTDGSWESLSVPMISILWGIGSAVTLAFYTLYPSSILRKWGSISIVGWGMFVGGLSLSILFPPWQLVGPQMSMINVLYIAFIILFGTLIAFYLYLDSLKYISPSEASVLASVEPLTATIASVVWLHVPFGIWSIIGGSFIIATVIILSIRSKKVEDIQSSSSQVESVKVASPN